MNDAVLIDTNILVYAKDQTSSFHSRVVQFLNTYEGDVYITSKNITEYLVAITRGDQPVSPLQEALEDIDDFTKAFTVIYPNANSHQQLMQLLKQYNPRGKKIHDFEIAAIALAHGVQQIATFNIHDFQHLNEIKLVKL